MTKKGRNRIIRARNMMVKHAERILMKGSSNTDKKELLLALNKAKESLIRPEDYERIRKELEDIQTYQDIQD